MSDTRDTADPAAGRGNGSTTGASTVSTVSTMASDEALSRRIDSAIDGLDVYPAEQELPGGERSIRDMRRSRSQGDDDSIGMLTLTEVDGVLQWEEAFAIGVAPGLGGGRRTRRGGAVEPVGRIVKQLKFRKLEPNKVGEFLNALDTKFAAGGSQENFGLRVWKEGDEEGVGTLEPAAGLDTDKPALLVIHGTFSNNDHIFSEISATDAGRELLHEAVGKYPGGILAFDHPTLAVSPILNALDIARALAGRTGPLDIICHSRGGLVTRWFLEGFNFAQGREVRAVLVGSPLNGTGFTDPNRLRATLKLITNVGSFLETGAEAGALAVPFLSAAVGILKVVTSITSLAADAPLFDAAVAMIPGLAAQSMVSNNWELRHLRTMVGDTPPDYYYSVCSNFEPEDIGWKFWKAFRKDQLADRAVDYVFDGPNDLVVDTPSMVTLFNTDKVDLTLCDRLPDPHVYQFQDGVRDGMPYSRSVHHTNYFRQPQTIAHIRGWLNI